MSVLRNAPDLAMVYIAERLGTSQQILIDALADEHRARPGRRQRPGRRPPSAGGDVPADHASRRSSPAQIVEPILDADALAVELAHALNGYLKP